MSFPLMTGIASKKSLCNSVGLDYEEEMEKIVAEQKMMEGQIMSEVLITTKSGVEVRALYGRPNIYQVKAGSVVDLCHFSFLAETIKAVETVASKSVFNRLGENNNG